MQPYFVKPSKKQGYKSSQSKNLSLISRNHDALATNSSKVQNNLKSQVQLDDAKTRSTGPFLAVDDLEDKNNSVNFEAI